MKKRINWQNVMLYFQCFLLIFAIILKIQYSIEYKFAAKWNTIISTSVGETHIGGDIHQHEALDVWLEESKKMIQQTQLQEVYPELAWDRLENISIYYYENDYENGEIVLLGQYLPSKNQIVVTPFLLSEEPLETIYTTIIHELIHALFIEAKGFGQLVEGVVETFTQLVAEENGISYTITAYYEEATFWQLLCNIWGTKNTVDMFLEGTLSKSIDSLTFWLAGKKLEAIIFFVGNYENLDVRSKMPKAYSKDELIMMAQDIICHATRNYANGIKDDAKKEFILDFCRDALIIPDEYFLEMLR